MRPLHCLVWVAAAWLSSIPAAPAPALPKSYLEGREPDTIAIIPSAPSPGSARDLADRRIFLATRALKGTPRWEMARADAAISYPDLLRDFSCSTGVNLTEHGSPALLTLLKRLTPDMVAAYGAPKDAYKRQRPYLRDMGDICLDRSEFLDKSWDYPSGHATFAWTIGLILSELYPDHAAKILARARAFGESRAVCGVHSASAVVEARTVGAALVSALHGDPLFRADLEAARLEAAPGMTKGLAPDFKMCAAEAALTMKTLW